MAEFLSPESAAFKYRELCRILGIRIREFGFKGSRGKWRREFEQSVQFCSVDKSHYSTQEKILFNVQVSVYNRTLGEFYWAPWKESHELGCHHWSFAPNVLASGQGLLIELTGSTSALALATEQFDLVRNRGIAAMDQVRTNAGAIDDLMSERPVGWLHNCKPEWLSVFAAVEKRADALQWAKGKIREMMQHPGHRQYLTPAHVRSHFKRLAEFVKDPSVELDIPA